MIKLRFIIFRFKHEKINYDLINFLRKHKIKFSLFNFSKKLKSKKIKIINYKSKNLKKLFIRMLSQKEEVCFFLHGSFDAYKEIPYLIKKTKWFFDKYYFDAGILDFNLNYSKYFYFNDPLNYNINKFYGLNIIKCPDPRCFAVRKDILSNFIDFNISTENFGKGLEIFLSFFCHQSNNKYICRDVSRKININIDLKGFKTLLSISDKNPKYNKKLNIYMENISSNVYFNLEYFDKIYNNKGPEILIGVSRPIMNKNLIKNNYRKPIDDFVMNDNKEITEEIKLYEA